MRSTTIREVANVEAVGTLVGNAISCAGYEERYFCIAEPWPAKSVGKKESSDK